MTDEEKESIAIKTIRDCLKLKNLEVQPGELFHIVREGHNIPIEDFAELIGVPSRQLADIEQCRVPFPTMMLISIFIHGIPAWYNGE